MALDGISIAALVDQFKTNLLDAHVERIIQPQPEVIQINFKTQDGIRRLCLSANASLPYLYESEKNLSAPLKAPTFCMLLRKHIGKGRLIGIDQPSLERIVQFRFSHLTEMKDEDTVTLVAEMMGKYSNLILVSSRGQILGAIRPVSGNVSSLREVLPGREYFLPDSLMKINPLEVEENDFKEAVCSHPGSVYQALIATYAGISPSTAYDLCYRANIEDKLPSGDLDKEQTARLYQAFHEMMSRVSRHDFDPCICYEHKRPKECCALVPATFPEESVRHYKSISEALEQYYSERAAQTFIRQKSSDLRHIITMHLDRANRKYHIQKKQLEDTNNKDTYRLYGEMIQSYAYMIQPGQTKLTADSFETGEPMSIPLDPRQSAQKNAQKYFAKYAKMKRTYDALSELIGETAQEIAYLESALCNLSLTTTDEDLNALRAELAGAGYAKRKGRGKKKSEASRPLHLISSDGYDIFIGKNNLQNDELTFKLAGNKDLWFHAKQMPGSHVIVLTHGKEDLPDRLYVEAASAAAYYSRGRGASKVDVDYVRRKEVKKPGGARPGYVIYHTNYSITVEPSIDSLKPVD